MLDILQARLAWNPPALFILSGLWQLWQWINDYLVVFALIGTGLFFTWLLRGVQFRMLGHSLRCLVDKRTSYADDKVNISPVQSFLTGLAARIGMGNIAGVAAAIHAGGPGAVFWMWVAALLGMATSFAENTLAQVYKVRNPDGTFTGGPAFYIRYGLKSKSLAMVFSVILAFTYGFAFVSLQTNQISDSLHHAYQVPHWTVAGMLLFLCGLIIFANLKTISNVSSVLIPIMSTIYIGTAIVLIAANYDKVPAAFMAIIHGAFNLDASLGATLGLAVKYGVKRGLFSNEAGMGSAPNIAACANIRHPVSQGLVQMLGVFFDTIVICTLTAFMILMAGVYSDLPELSGASLAQASIVTYIGAIGQEFLVLMIFLFAFTSVLGYYIYGKVGLEYFTNNKTAHNTYRIAVLFFVAWGAFSTPTLVWDVADVFMLIMTLVNVVAILLLYRPVYTLLLDYRIQRQRGIQVPVFNIDKYPRLRAAVDDASIWNSKIHNVDDDGNEIAPGTLASPPASTTLEANNKTMQ